MNACPQFYDLDLDAADLAVRRVRALRRLAERGLVAGDADERGVATSVLECLDRGDADGVMAVCGLTGLASGALRRDRLMRRDNHLRRISRACWPDLSQHAASQVIASRWRRYAALHGRAGRDPATDPDATLARLLDHGHTVLSARRIREILSGHVGDITPLRPPT